MTGSSAARSSDRVEQRDRVLYLLSAELSLIFVRGQLGALHESGFDVHLATNYEAGEPSRLDDTTTTWHVAYEREPSPVKDLRALVATVKLLRRIRPDIVHAGTPNAKATARTATVNGSQMSAARTLDRD